METELIKEIREGLKNDPNWVERWGSRHIVGVCCIFESVLKEEVPAAFIARQSSKMPMPIIIQKYFTRYRLYEALRKHKRCKKNDHGEKMLKKMKEQEK